MAAVAHAGAGNVTPAGTSGTTLTINKPANTAEGDLLVALIGHQNGTDATRTWVTPTGWSKRLGDGQAFRTMMVATKVATAAEPATYEFGMTSHGSGRLGAVMVRVTGVDHAAPIVTGMGEYQATSSGPIALGTSSAIDGLVLGFIYTSTSGGSYPTPTYTGGLTHVGYGGTDNAGSTNTLCYIGAGPLSGASVSPVATVSMINGEGATISVAALPEPAPAARPTRWIHDGTNLVPVAIRTLP